MQTALGRVDEFDQAKAGAKLTIDLKFCSYSVSCGFV